MASSAEFTAYVCDQLRDAGPVTSKKMFGEYGIFLGVKMIGVVCDDQFFLKKTQAGAHMLRHPVEASPYEGAKPYYLIESLDERALLVALVQKMYDELPFPKPRKKKQPQNG